MPATIPAARLSRFAILAVTSATALSLAACGSSNDAKPNSASPSRPAPASSSAPSAKGEGKNWVKGLIDSISGSTIQVSQRSGSATVDFSPSTTVSELGSAQLTDIVTGNCVSVPPDRRGDSPGGNAITARSVRISSAIDGTCPEPKQSARHLQTSGQVASVAGNTITLNGADPSGNSSQTAVTVTQTTKYTKKTATDAQAITQGKCIVAQGTKDGGGALQATAITVQPADNGQCPQPGHERHRH